MRTCAATSRGPFVSTKQSRLSLHEVSQERHGVVVNYETPSLHSKVAESTRGAHYPIKFDPVMRKPTYATQAMACRRKMCTLDQPVKGCKIILPGTQVSTRRALLCPDSGQRFDKTQETEQTRGLNARALAGDNTTVDRLAGLPKLNPSGILPSRFLCPPLLSRLFPLLPEVESWRAFEADSFLAGAGSALFLASAAFWAFSAATLFR